MTFTEIKRINNCIKELQSCIDDIPQDELDWYNKAIDILQEYRDTTKDYMENEYRENMYDEDSDWRFCF